jgi:hypothetical protein
MPKITSQNPKKPDSEKKIIVAITMDQDIVQWVKEWAARRERSFSWGMNYFAKVHRNKELAEKHFGQKVTR